MKQKKLIKISITLAFAFLVAFFGINNVYSHCDTMDGPVIKDAKAALEKQDVTTVLKWVDKKSEPQIIDAFKTALAERSKNAEAQKTADTKFFETLVKIHRQGEGEPFTGLKPAGSVEPIIAKADKAIEKGSVDSLAKEMAAHLKAEIKERFDKVIEKKKHMNDSVEAGREYVKAYIEYVHYVENIHKAVSSKDVHHEQEDSETQQHHEHQH